MSNGRKINVHELPKAIEEAVKAANQKFPQHELIMGFIAPEALAEAEAQKLAQQVAHQVAPGAQVVNVVTAAGGAAQPEAAGAAHAAGTLLGRRRLLGFVASPNQLVS